jgi:hypothetical protein
MQLAEVFYEIQLFSNKTPIIPKYGGLDR